MIIEIFSNNKIKNKNVEEKIVQNLNKKDEIIQNNIKEKTKEITKETNYNLLIINKKTNQIEPNTSKEKYFQPGISKTGLAFLDDFNNMEEDQYFDENDELITDFSLEKTKPVPLPNNIYDNQIGLINYQPPVNTKTKIHDYNALDSSLPYLFDLLYEDKNINEPGTIIPKVFQNAEEYKDIWLQFVSHEAFLEISDHYRNLKKHKESISVTNFDSRKYNNFNSVNFNYTDTRKIIYKNDLIFFHDTTDIFISEFNSTSIDEIMKITENTCFGFVYDESSKTSDTFKITSTCKCMILKQINENSFRKMRNVFAVHGLSSKIREILAIERIDSYDTGAFILNPEIPKWRNQLVHFPNMQDKVNKFLNQCENSKLYNDSQLNALSKILTFEEDVYLLLGPPGTGKTHTLGAVISYCYNNFKNKKILICCPSNSAVNEITSRISIRGLIDENFKTQKNTKFVRFYTEQDEEDDSGASKKNKKNKINEYSLDNFSKSVPKGKKVLDEIEILLTTLSSSAHRLIQKYNAKILIIDEAAQATEPSCLIPLNFNIEKTILVGDFKQLPAFTNLKNSEKTKFEMSLMERMYGNKDSSLMLTIQHRMHPKISQFISETFYDGLLKDGEATTKSILDNPIYKIFSSNKAAMFFHVKNGKEKLIGTSYINTQNSEFVGKLLNIFNDLVSNFSERTGIITTYNSQFDYYNDMKFSKQCSTIDGSQGSEMDFVIVDLVKTSSFPFMKRARLNVALSRAKLLLIVVGSPNCEHEIIKKFADYAFSNKSLIVVDSYMSEEAIKKALLKENILN